MEVPTFHKGTWKAEAHAEELASGKFQGVVLLFNEEHSSKEQIMHRALDVSDTADEALEEAQVLAQRVLHNI
ncbi:hypothetical protein [Noviherbaspirillum massiliense]|uniref:hypothetical protein n=1 Tax=Noviherbaspirillum massiliense TaxID=1465823 RepID=UPI00030D1C5A|nr:hypothetical protein [Noviherbaspirillum massiliense]